MDIPKKKKKLKCTLNDNWLVIFIKQSFYVLILNIAYKV